jgi:PAS domain S-box-containing protein
MPALFSYRKKRNLAVIALGAVLVGYIAFLLMANYHSQVELQKSGLEQMRLDTEKHAGAVSYFFSEQKDHLKNLMEKRELAAFFENKALGMSLEYGLRDSVLDIAMVFDRFLENRRIGGDRIYTRIVFLESNGAVLVDRPADNSNPANEPNWQRFLAPEHPDPKIIVEPQGSSWQIMVSTPYFFKGAFSGQIIAWISSETVYRHVVKTTGGASQRLANIINAKGESLYSPGGPRPEIEIWGSHDFHDLCASATGEVHRFASSRENGSKVDMIAMRVPLPDTPFFLVAVAPAAAVFGHTSPRQLLAVLAILSLAILGGVAIMVRGNTRNLVLQARLEEAAESRQAVEDKNRQLEQEIRERQLAEQARQQSEEKYRLLVSQIPAMVFQGYGDWSIDPVDEKVEVLTGYSKEDFEARRVKWCDLIPGEDLDYAARVFMEALKTDKSYVREHRLRKKDGGIIWVQCRGQIFLNDQGKVDHISGVSFDVTARRQAEEALKESERFLADIFASIQDGINILDTDYHILRGNPTAERWYAHALPLAGKKCYEVFHGRREPCEICPYRQTLETGKAAHKVSQRMGKDAVEAGWIEIFTFPLTDTATGKVTGVIEYVRDITEQKQAEEALHRSEAQLRQAVKMEAVGQLAGGVAHDFNNILTAITGYGELLLMNPDIQDPVSRDVKDILQSAERAASLTRQLLAFSRKQVLQPQRLDLNQVVANLDKMLRRIIGEDIDLEMVLGPELGAVKADPGQIEQVIMNLAANARDAMPQGGKLTIETANADLDEAYAQGHLEVQSGPYVMLAVIDTGVGLDPESQARIFEPFFTTKELGKGTGLGLSMVYGIVRQSGGFIYVYSDPGEGTTFKIYLPRLEAMGDSAAGLGQVLDRCDWGPETILLVEDEDMVRQVASRILVRHGYTVLEAASGRDALLVSQEHAGPIHLMLTDVVMPGMSGWETAENLKPHRPEMKVLFMSGHTENTIVHHGVLDPGVAFIQKPFRYNVLAQKIREMLDASQDR